MANINDSPSAKPEKIFGKIIVNSKTLLYLGKIYLMLNEIGDHIGPPKQVNQFVNLKTNPKGHAKERCKEECIHQSHLFKKNRDLFFISRLKNVL